MNELQSTLSSFHSFFQTDTFQKDTIASAESAIKNLLSCHNRATTSNLTTQSATILIEKIERTWTRIKLALAQNDDPRALAMHQKLQKLCTEIASEYSNPKSAPEVTPSRVFRSLFAKHPSIAKQALASSLSEKAKAVATQYPRSIEGTGDFITRVSNGSLGQQLLRALEDPAESFLYDCARLQRLLLVDSLTAGIKPSEKIGWFKKAPEELQHVIREYRNFIQTTQTTCGVTLSKQDRFYLLSKMKPEVPEILKTKINEVLAKSRLDVKEYNSVLEHFTHFTNPSEMLTTHTLRALRRDGKHSEAISLLDAIEMEESIKRKLLVGLLVSSLLYNPQKTNELLEEYTSSPRYKAVYAKVVKKFCKTILKDAKSDQRYLKLALKYSSKLDPSDQLDTLKSLLKIFTLKLTLSEDELCESIQLLVITINKFPAPQNLILIQRCFQKHLALYNNHPKQLELSFRLLKGFCSHYAKDTPMHSLCIKTFIQQLLIHQTNADPRITETYSTLTSQEQIKCLESIAITVCATRSAKDAIQKIIQISQNLEDKNFVPHLYAQACKCLLSKNKLREVKTLALLISDSSIKVEIEMLLTSIKQSQPLDADDLSSVLSSLSLGSD